MPENKWKSIPVPTATDVRFHTQYTHKHTDENMKNIVFTLMVGVFLILVISMYQYGVNSNSYTVAPHPYPDRSSYPAPVSSEADTENGGRTWQYKAWATVKDDDEAVLGVEFLMDVRINAEPILALLQERGVRGRLSYDDLVPVLWS